MKHFKTMLAAVVAVTALAAVASAGASAAEPALFQCGSAPKNAEKHFTGGFTDKKCSVPSATHEGKYNLEEWNLGSAELKTGKKGKVKKFKGKGKGANLEVKQLGGIACTSSTDTGEFNGPKSAANVAVTFKGCELAHHTCQNTATAGEIKTNALKGEIGYIEGGAAKHEVGVALTSQTGIYLGEFKCGELEIRVHGTVIGLVTSTKNAFTKEATLLFQQSGGEQRIKKLEGGPTDVLLTESRKTGAEWPIEAAESGEETESTGKGEELELKA
jgi:opacity protein-like surface antigen